MASTNSIRDIAIIGAGLGGLGAALAIHSQDFDVTIYEQAPSSERFAGAIMLSPNALRILDTYGVYDRIKAKGHPFTYVDHQDNNGNSVDHQFLGSRDIFSYDALRIYRNTFRTELETAVRERGINVKYGKKFSGIVNEDDQSVTCAFADGTQATSSLLIAADGIWSKVRSVLFPGAVPVYQGFLVVAGSVHASALTIPKGIVIDKPISQSSKAGAFLLAPQSASGDELLAGTQHKFPEQDRKGWEKIAADRSFQKKFLLEGVEHRSELMQSAAKGIEEDSMYTWALHKLPLLPKWHSEMGRVILIGDAAHAIPPTTGQGANQAFEDGHSLALLLAKKPTGTTVGEAIDWWQGMREQRVGKLLDMTRRLNNMRLPEEEQRKLRKEDLWESGEGGAEAMRWLFEPKIEEVVEKWVGSQR